MRWAALARFISLYEYKRDENSAGDRGYRNVAIIAIKSSMAETQSLIL
jgi:hypothetical protein